MAGETFDQRSAAGSPRVVLDWLRHAGTGGVHRHGRHGMSFVGWQRVLEDVERVGDHLQRQGIGPGDRVGVRGHNSYEWLVLDLALLKLSARAVALPVPDFKGRRNDELARTYGIAAMFCDPTERTAGDGAAPLESILELPPVPRGGPVGPPQGRRLPPDDRDYFSVAFSSGTGGRVKSLLMYWPGVGKLIEATMLAYGLRTDDRIMIALPLSTFQQRYLCYLAIRCGCDIVLTTAARYMQALVAGEPTILLGPPGFYEFALTRFRNEPRRRRRRRVAAARVAALLPGSSLRKAVRRRLFRQYHAMFGGRARLMLVGSAPVARELLDFFEVAGFELDQIYGMTESGYLTWNRPRANRIGSVGRETYPGTVSVADDGEILVRHPWHICVGYEGEEPDDVSAVFRGQDAIATGDIGEFVDGYLYLKGRKKHVIVTTGGQKLQVEDLEEDIAKVAGVNRVALVAVPDEESGLALVVWHQGNEAAVRDSLRPRVEMINRRLGHEQRITRIALAEGELNESSPLLNRNLKLDRAAVTRAMAQRTEAIEW